MANERRKRAAFLGACMSKSEKPQTRDPFGVRAIRLGFVNVEQVEKALAVQKMLAKNGQNQLIGMIMVDLEMLSTTQMLAVLRTYQNDQA